jgi:osmotically inducible lipoprotein OsmB
LPPEGLQLNNEVNKMTKTKLMIAATAASLMALTGCSSNPSSAQIGTGVGAVVGGVAGSALGGTAATVGGAAAGALIGNELGKRQDRK